MHAHYFNKLDNQAIQLNTIAVEIIEQNEDLNILSTQSVYIDIKELETI